MVMHLDIMITERKEVWYPVIAERANIATGTFYHFFDSKEAYVQALIEEQNQKMQEAIRLQLNRLLQVRGIVRFEFFSFLFSFAI